MKNVFSIVLIILLSGIGWSQWEWQNPKPQGNTLRSLFFPSINVGYACGHSGTVIKTTDGGTTWVNQNLHSSEYLYSIFFINENTGWIFGDNNLFKTTNGGTVWFKLSRSYGSQGKVFFYNESIGWMVGMSSRIYKTTNGGATWQNISFTTQGIYDDVYFVNQNTGWIVAGYNGGIIKTTDGGITWTQKYADLTKGWSSLSFINSSTGWVVGSKILKTTNGGDTWTEQTYPSTGGDYLKAVHFTDANNGFVASLNGYILKTTNGGNTWTIQKINSSVWSMKFTSSSTGYTVGGGGCIHKTTNSGINWNPYSNAFLNNTIYSVTFSDPNNGWVVGTWGYGARTTNGGSSWLSNNFSTSNHLRDICFINSSTGFVAGDTGILYRTTNAGANWNLQSIGVTKNLNSICFSNASTGWIAGSRGLLLKTTNAGSTWAVQAQVDTFDYRTIFFADANNGWIGGNVNRILKTTNGGQSWNIISPVGVGLINSIYFINPSVGFFTGGAGNIYKSTDGGITWSQNSVGITYADLNALKFNDLSNGFCVGWNGQIYRTTDGGENWTREATKSEGLLTDIYVRDNNTCWAVGSYGTVLYTSNGGESLINISLWISNGVNMSLIGQKLIHEGEKYIFPAKTLDPPFTKYQTVYNALDSSVFYLEPGAVFGNKDIQVLITLPAGDSLYGLIGGKKVWFYGVFEVNGIEGEFYFLNNKYAVLKIPKTQDFNYLVTLLGWPASSYYTWYFGYYNNAEAKWDSVGIESQNLTDTVIAKISHFSEIGAGDEDLVVSVMNNKINILPSEYKLYQNYPNPFNPVTKIKYQIPEYSGKTDRIVTIKIYDILGREVKTVINEIQNAGIYEVDFNAIGISSGIYFYKLQCGEYNSTRKMILIK